MKTFTADEIAMAIDTIGNTVYRDTVANSDRNCLLDIIAHLQAENARLRGACQMTKTSLDAYLADLEKSDPDNEMRDWDFGKGFGGTYDVICAALEGKQP